MQQVPPADFTNVLAEGEASRTRPCTSVIARRWSWATLGHILGDGLLSYQLTEPVRSQLATRLWERVCVPRGSRSLAATRQESMVRRPPARTTASFPPELEPPRAVARFNASAAKRHTIRALDNGRRSGGECGPVLRPIQQIVSAIQGGERRPAAQRPRRARGAAAGDRGRVQAPALAACSSWSSRAAARPRRRSAPGSRSRCRCSRPLTSRRSSPPTATGARACCPTSPAWSQPPSSRAWALVALDCALEPTRTEEANANLLASVAPFERQPISQRTKGGARGHARAGRPARTPPTISQYASDRIRREQTAGTSLAATANGPNADRVPTAQGGRRWYPATIRHTLNRTN
jgi:hypothetical protein